MTPEQERLKAKHGTPWEFRQACLRAYQALTITGPEFTAAVRKYQDEWNAAGMVDTYPLNRAECARLGKD